MGGMMGSGGIAGWLVFLIVLGVAAAVTAGVVIVRVLLGSRRSELPQARGGQQPEKLDEARAALRMRYANGEISREEYLQGKVELED